MTWNGSPTTIIEGKCAVCEKDVKRKVTIHTARQMKRITCGGWNCRNKLSIRRSREKAKGVRG